MTRTINPNLELPTLSDPASPPCLSGLVETFIGIQRRVPLLFESCIAPYDLSFLAWNVLALIEPPGKPATLRAIRESVYASPSTWLDEVIIDD